MNYLTNLDLEELNILLSMRMDTLRDRADEYHQYEREELALYREIKERLILEIKNNIEKGIS